MMSQAEAPRRLVRDIVARDGGNGVHVMVVCCALAVEAFVLHRHASSSDSSVDAVAVAATNAAAAATAAATALERWSASGCAPCDGWMAWAFVWLLTEVVCERLQLLPPPVVVQYVDVLSAFSSYRRSPGKHATPALPLPLSPSLPPPSPFTCRYCCGCSSCSSPAARRTVRDPWRVSPCRGVLTCSTGTWWWAMPTSTRAIAWFRRAPVCCIRDSASSHTCARMRCWR
jgi:hypothetical protein